MPTLSDLARGGGLLGLFPPARTCRYHADTNLIQVEQPLALTSPPPHQVIFGIHSPRGPVAQTSPASVAVTAWYCPICTYLELHYVPAQ